MSTLRRTELRHRMLAAVEAGNVMFRPARSGRDIGRYQPRSGGWSSGEKRAVNDVDQAGLVTWPSGFDIRKKAELTDAGRVLLAEWDAKYGEVQP